MSEMPKPGASTLTQIRWLLSFFIVGLILSGVTAFPLQWELGLLTRWLHADLAAPVGGMHWWIARVNQGLVETAYAHPFLAYGTDWLAFGHIVIALFFIGPWIDPVRNAWVLRIGLVACLGILPLAFICGPVRGIPFYWRLIDCSFGVFGAIPLIICLNLASRLQGESPSNVRA
jgi:hypothetical protein